MIRNMYDTVLRPVLPRKVIVHNGVPARTGRLLDANDQRADWKAPLLESIRRQAKTGQRVVEVGGGFGICTAAIAKQVQPTGSVITYEGDPERCNAIRDTPHLNKIREYVEIKNQFIAKNSNIPDCDMMVLDCEGTELSIFSGEVSGDPDTIIVETHPDLGAETQDVIDILEAQGYTTSVRSDDTDDVVEAKQ